MKAFSVCLVILALTIFVQATSEPVNCKYPNIYLRFLERNANLKIPNHPNFMTKKCFGEWNKHGSCCPDSEIDRLAKYRIRKTAEKYAKRDAAMDAILIKIQEFKNKYFVVNKSDKNNLKLQHSIMTEISGNKIALDLLDHLKKLLVSMPPLFEKSKAIKGGCDKKLLQVRLESFCPICSGISKRYFLKNRLIMNKRDCMDVIDTCNDLWEVLASLVKKVKSYKTELRSFLNVIEQSEEVRNSLIPDITVITGWMNINLSKYVTKCSNSKTCDLPAASELCQKFIVIYDRDAVSPPKTARALGKKESVSRRLHQQKCNQDDVSNPHANNSPEENRFSTFEDEVLQGTFSGVMVVASHMCHSDSLMQTYHTTVKNCAPMNMTLNFP